MTRSTPPNCLLSNSLLSSSSNTKHSMQKWFMHIKQVYFVLSKQEESVSSSPSRHFVSNDQNKLCTHDKNRIRAELWVKINLCNVFVMYALDSAHVKVRRLKRSRSFARRSIRQARSNRTAGRPKYKFVEPNWFKRRTLHVPNLMIRFGTCKIRRLNQALETRKTEIPIKYPPLAVIECLCNIRTELETLHDAFKKRSLNFCAEPVGELIPKKGFSCVLVVKQPWTAELVGLFGKSNALSSKTKVFLSTVSSWDRIC